jgi:hypothetical protein
VKNQINYICVVELKFDIPFQQLLKLVKSLTPKQSERLRQELESAALLEEENDEFIKFLLKGPVYLKDDINQIMKNRNNFMDEGLINNS